jgi:hypothetical protein
VISNRNFWPLAQKGSIDYYSTAIKSCEASKHGGAYGAVLKRMELRSRPAKGPAASRLEEISRDLPLPPLPCDGGSANLWCECDLFRVCYMLCGSVVSFVFGTNCYDAIYTDGQSSYVIQSYQRWCAVPLSQRAVCSAVRYATSPLNDGVQYRLSWRVVCSAVRCAEPPKMACVSSLSCWLYEPGGV